MPRRVLPAQGLALGVGPSTLRFTKADAESFLSYADGAGTTVSVDL